MAFDKSRDIYSKIQSAYRAKFLKAQKQLEKEFGEIADEFDAKIQRLVFKYAQSDGVLDKRYLTEINREIDAIVHWFTQVNAEWVNKNLLQSASLAIDAQDAAAKMYVRAAIEEYKGIDRALLTKAATDPAAPFLLRTVFGTGLPKKVRTAVWQKRWVDGFNLSDRIWKQDKVLRQNLHGMIEQCVNQGLSAVEFSRAVEQYLLKPGPAWTTKITPSVTGRGSIKYNALRLARTETNNAYRTGHALGAKNSTIVKGIKWNLSRSHPEEDICDTWATQDLYGLGPGVYPPDKLPPGHPNCLCYLTDVLLQGEELIKALKEKYQIEDDEGDEEEEDTDKEISGKEYLGKIENIESLGGGASETFTGFVNGKKYVFKVDEPVEALDMLTSNVEGEILSSKIFNKLGLPAPKVKYGMFDVNGEQERLMAFDFVEDGISVRDFLADIGFDAIQLDQFRQMQVIDLLIGNGDRHNRNLFLVQDGSIIPFDHNLAFATNKVICSDTTWQKCFLETMNSLESHQTPEHILLRNDIGKRLYQKEGVKNYNSIIRKIQNEMKNDVIEKMVKPLPAAQDRKKELVDILKWRRDHLTDLISIIGK